jgi:hypothetical protein
MGYFLLSLLLSCTCQRNVYVLVFGTTNSFVCLQVLDSKGHCVVCIAEGAGQDILDAGEKATDASGNAILQDVGIWLRDEVKKFFKVCDAAGVPC